MRDVEEGFGCPAGRYRRYTQAQEDALIELLLWLKRNDPTISNIGYILCHHEVSRKEGIGFWRKNDPGGSLSMPMKDLRAKIVELL